MRNIFTMMAVITIFAISVPSYAYLEPSTGSVLIQTLLAFFSGLFITVKIYWHKIISIFTKKNIPLEPSGTSSKDETSNTVSTDSQI